MKTNKYLIVSFLALLSAGCQDDDMGGGTAARPGDEVAFSVSLGENTATRTVYGNYSNSSYPIEWTSTDTVVIASPNCLEADGGNPTGTYKVTPTGDATTGKLTADGTGVQWGADGYNTATFYSVYPGDSEYADISTSDYSTATLKMPTTQTITRDSEGAITYDMNACFMYAKTYGNRWNTVQLTYVPISTALRFSLQGSSSGTVNVSSITVTAPTTTMIAGNFEAKLADVSGNTSSTSTTVPTLSGGSSNSITIEINDGSNEYLTLSGEHDTFEVNVFLLLAQNSVTINATDSWEIKVTTTDREFTKTLTSGTLTSGRIHELGTLPALEKGHIVSDAAGLLAWAAAAQDDPSLDCTLAANINLSGYTWTPVGTSDDPYTGTFNGNGHTISNLSISQSSTSYVGLIGVLGSGGVVQNLDMSPQTISGRGYVGAVVGQNKGTVSNCTVWSGTVTGTSNYVGGVAGTNERNSIMTGCVSYANVTSTSVTVGGVVGMNDGFMTGCSCNSNLIEGTMNVGGVAGINSYPMIACYSRAHVEGTSNVGGVVGLNSHNMAGCYHGPNATSNSVTGSSNVGGVVGSNSGSNAQVTGCYWNNNQDAAYGFNGGNGSVSASSVNNGSWSDTHVTTMNNAITTWNNGSTNNRPHADLYGQCTWRYQVNGTNPPTLTESN